MAGETFFFFCIAILLFWNLWERIKNRRRLASLNSRIRQLEELLLEVCAVLEESRNSEEPAASRAGQLVPAEEPAALAGLKAVEITEEPPEEPEKPEETGKPEEAGEPEERVTPLPPAGGREHRDHQAAKGTTAGERQAGEEENEREEEEGPAAIADRAGGEESVPPELPAADRRRQVLELFHQGIPVKTIARRFGMGQGEAQLIIDLYARRGKEG